MKEGYWWILPVQRLRPTRWTSSNRKAHTIRSHLHPTATHLHTAELCDRLLTVTTTWWTGFEAPETPVIHTQGSPLITPLMLLFHQVRIYPHSPPGPVDLFIYLSVWKLMQTLYSLRMLICSVYAVPALLQAQWFLICRYISICVYIPTHFAIFQFREVLEKTSAKLRARPCCRNACWIKNENSMSHCFVWEACYYQQSNIVERIHNSDIDLTIIILSL